MHCSKRLKTMFDHLIDKIKENISDDLLFQELLIERNIPGKTILLVAGDISKHIFFVKKGCLREWFNKDGKDITIQFFFEDQAVASIDSFLNNEPSLFTIESIEPSVVVSISKESFEYIKQISPEFKDRLQDYLFQRFRTYAQLFLSRIKDSPKERYDDLLHNRPDIIQRVPQHHIASYLGITPISLSRIKNRK